MIDRDAVQRAIRNGDVDADTRLDGCYPEEFARFRAQHATPVDVAAVAASWLAAEGATRVLDVGAGAGRFCLVGALTTGLRFTGVERRAWLVEAARAAAVTLDATRAEFVCGDAVALDWSGYDGVYLFNPFAEHLLPENECIDLTRREGYDGFAADVAAVERHLANAPSGTVVVTWNGFGGALEGYTCVRRRWLLHTALDCLRRV